MLPILFGALTVLFAGALRRRYGLAIGALLLALVLPIPTGVGAEAPPDIVVYDYTTTSAPFWTPIIISTVDEFNAVRPATAPRLVYSAESGSFDCLDLPPPVANRAGIIICDTSRPEDFPYNPNAPKEGWAGSARQVDDDTMSIALNSVVPDAYFLSAEADNTVCHEMMHVYTGVHDNYDSDAQSCVFGDLLSPGTTDVRLMTERWPAMVAAPSPRQPVPAPASTGSGWVIIVLAILVPLIYALLKLFFRLLRGWLGWGALIITGLFVFYLLSMRATDAPVEPAQATSIPRPTPTSTAKNVPVAPIAESPNETGEDADPATEGPEVATTDEPTAVPDDAVDAAEAPRAGAADRRQCDPAYPEERTCIPPGPPLDQPCAITSEFNFTVLPPDPRRLDADGDGIGCEPITP